MRRFTKCVGDRALIPLFRKHHGWLAAQAYKLILLAAALARLLLSPLAWLERPPQRQKHLALAGHYRRLVVLRGGDEGTRSRGDRETGG